MRIAIVAHSAARLGGVETYLGDLIPALGSRGHEVACWFESTEPRAAPILSPSHTGPAWMAPVIGGDVLHPLRQWRPDVVYLHGLRSVEIERQLPGIAPVAFFAHSYYGACIGGERSTRFPLTRPCERVFGPACLAHYFPRRCGGWSPATMVEQYRLQREKQHLLREFATVLVASRHMAHDYARQQIAARVLALPATAMAPCPRPRTAALNLLYLGRLERSKGVEIALRSAARVSAEHETPVRLVVAGRGSRACALAREAAALMREHPGLTIELPGWLAEGARRQALAATDLLLMPSLWPEPFGLAGVEAASAGVPAIAFRVGGIEDWLIDGLTGRLVPLEGDRIVSFAKAIVETVSDVDRFDAMRREAAAAAERFSMEAHLDRLESMLRDVLTTADRAVRPA